MAGNANSGRRQEKPFADALAMEIASAGEDRKDLRQIARVLISKAKAGDMQAMTCLIDRLDGKPMQQIESHNVNENHFVKAPEKAAKDDWAQYLAHKTKAPVAEKKTNGSSNGKSH